MNTVFVGVGECKASKNPDEVIKTMALGSCVAVIFLDPINRAIGMVHVALPDSSINKERMQQKPCMFADSGIPKLINQMKSFGYKDRGRLIVKVAGGATIMDPNQTFNIGKRNILAVKKILWKYRLGALAEDVGKNHSRTVAVSVKTGKVVISSPGRGEWEI